MYFKPQQLGFAKLDQLTLRQDKTDCKKFGPCGVGEKALYLNSFYIDRKFYLPVSSVTRVFKRVAMSKGGFSGKGLFGAMPYLVVVYDGGKEKQCNFKFEANVDLMLACIRERFPQIKTISEPAEKRLAAAQAERAARRRASFTPAAEQSVAELARASAYLEKRPELAIELSAASKAKRVNEATNPAYKWVALAIVLAGVGCAVYGGVALARHSGSFGVYFLLGGLAAIFLFAGANVLPTARNNSKAVAARLAAARQAMGDYLAGYPGFPLPAQYAHPAALARMQRAVEEGQADTLPEAYEALKAGLKALNNTVTVSQEEYDEVVAIKPMFLVENYG